MTIGVLTAGGEAAGVNAALRALVLRAQEYGHRVLGIKDGWQGLLGPGEVELLEPRYMDGMVSLGGSILATSRLNPLRDEKQLEQIKANLRRYAIDVLVVLGGDDTMKVAAGLAQSGIPVVGVPKTIENDVEGSDYSIGFDSAVSVIASALDNLQAAARAQRRVVVLEVEGKDTGWLAAVGGLAGGADFIIVPEEQPTLEQICRHVQRRWQEGSRYSLIVVAKAAPIAGLPEPHPFAEHTGLGHRLAVEISRGTGHEARSVHLGQLQRGGSPSAFDRILAHRLGRAAADFAHRRQSCLVALQGNQVVPVDLTSATGQGRRLNRELLDLLVQGRAAAKAA